MAFHEIAFRLHHQDSIKLIFKSIFSIFYHFLSFFDLYQKNLFKSITFFKILEGFLLLFKHLYTLFYIINNKLEVLVF